MMTFFEKAISGLVTMWSLFVEYMPLFINGIKYTVLLAFFTVLIGCVLALVLALMRLSKIKPLAFFAKAYIEIFRCTPVLVQLSLFYYGVFSMIEVPKMILFGFVDTTMFVPAIVTLGLNSSAYVAEIIRAGIMAVDQGQGEAARSLGLTSGQAMRFVILPQAVKNILPAIANEFVVIIKESSVCMVIGLKDVMWAARSVMGSSFKPMAPILIAAIIYFLLTYPTSQVIGYFERRMRRGDVR